MSSILLRPVEYPQAQILDIDDLTETGLESLKMQAQSMIEEIEEKLNTLRN